MGTSRFSTIIGDYISARNTVPVLETRKNLTMRPLIFVKHRWHTLQFWDSETQPWTLDLRGFSPWECIKPTSQNSELWETRWETQKQLDSQQFSDRLDILGADHQISGEGGGQLPKKIVQGKLVRKKIMQQLAKKILLPQSYKKESCTKNCPPPSPEIWWCARKQQWTKWFSYCL